MCKFKIPLLEGICFVLMFASCDNTPTSVKRDIFNIPFTNDTIENIVDSVYNIMPNEEKIAQLYGIRPQDLMVDGKFSLEECKKKIPYGIGHLCQFASSIQYTPEQMAQFVFDVQEYIKNNTKSSIPALMQEEAITGLAMYGVTTYPQHIGVGCTWNPELVEQKTEQTAETMIKAGSFSALSPMLDVSRNPFWGRMEESFGEDGYLTAVMGLAFVDGFQKNGLENGVSATVKHFAGYGATSENEKEFYEQILFPFEVAIRLGGAKAVMTGYHSHNDVPCTTNEDLLKRTLRQDLCFDGLIMSDNGSIARTVVGKDVKTISPGFARNRQDAAVLAMNAGVDMEHGPGMCYPYLEELIDSGKISMEQLEHSVKQVLRLKARLGLFSGRKLVAVNEKLDYDPVSHRKTAYDLASQSIVMLKNDGVLPLSDKIKKIAIVGPNADSFQSLLGDYTYQSLSAFWWMIPTNDNFPKLFTLNDGLKNNLDKDIELLYERGCQWSEESDFRIDGSKGDPRLARLERVRKMAVGRYDTPDWDKAMEYAKASDVVIAAMGENLYLCGEGRTRESITLPGRQEEFVKALISTGKPVILVLFGGRPQVITDLVSGCSAILQAWFPGEEGGNAIADIIKGDVNPSGKLCVSYPKYSENKQICYNTTDSESILYPFGYGLSYTDYEYSDLRMNESVECSENFVSVEFKIGNTGKMAGTEIVQMYIQSPGSDKKFLKGFKRVKLELGEKKTVRFEFSPQQLANYDNGIWKVTPGEYKLYIGSSSEDMRLEHKFNLTGSPVEMKYRTILLSSSSVQ